MTSLRIELEGFASKSLWTEPCLCVIMIMLVWDQLSN